MMNNNKILTVSYGTFSCTLEGFDDSFGTMKAIAEYFRDLASDDRYFGAEPPQPDAEMLARIAQKEVSRRVEAREQDGKIVLSALEDGAQQKLADQTVATPKVATAAIVAASEAVEQAAAQPVESDPLEVEESLKIVPALAEIEPVETEETPVDVAEEKAAEIEAEAEVAVSEVAFVEDENDIVPGQPDADVEAFFADSPSASDVDEDAEEDAAAAPLEAAEAEEITSEPDSIAAKLQRIRAVVAQHEEPDDEDDYLEDEHAETDAGAKDVVATRDLIAEARADIEDALEADEEIDAPEIETYETDDADDADDVNAILSRLEADTDEVDTADAEQIAEQSVQTERTNERSVEDTVSNLFDENEESLAEIDRADVDLEELPELSASDEVIADTEEAATPRARVIKVKRADLEAAIESGELEEYGDDSSLEREETNAADAEPKERDLDDIAPARKKKTALSPEDEAELARELADLEDDIDADDEDADSAPERRVAANLPSIDENADTDVDRLLAETDHQMDEPESATRRDAFAHLRAAVAAKKADVAAGEPTIEEVRDDAYRDDLAQVVRPRRPTSGSGRTERPKDARPAPLKLVAEQRIDVAKPVTEGPVRPRRIAAQSEAVVETPEGESFVDFASDMGASTLPQLLEAAAAYMSFVEGREQFSRPQLMSKVRQAGGEDGFSREETLRSFGQLLRNGKIEKIKAGRFTVSEDIGFRPDQRAAG